jgi:hypothetical protein
MRPNLSAIYALPLTAIAAETVPQTNEGTRGSTGSSATGAGVNGSTGMGATSPGTSNGMSGSGTEPLAPTTLFRELDANRDGYIDRTEIKNATQPRLDFKSLDTNEVTE